VICLRRGPPGHGAQDLAGDIGPNTQNVSDRGDDGPIYDDLGDGQPLQTFSSPGVRTMSWSAVWPSFVGIVLGGGIALAGTLLSWFLARRAELRDRPRTELVPVASRFLAAVEAVYVAEQAHHLALSRLTIARHQDPPDPKAIEESGDNLRKANQSHRQGLIEARTASAELGLLYPSLDKPSRCLLERTDIEGRVMRSEEEAEGFEAARDDLMAQIAAICR
jgi:hypothetical protein